MSGLHASGLPAAGPAGGGGEYEALARLAAFLPAPPPGEVWAGDDAAVVKLPGTSTLGLLAADTVVAGLDADLSLTTLADLGWKALAVNLSDIAAMGGRPAHAVVSVVGLGADGLASLYEGMLAAAARFACPVVGGDLSGGDQVVVSVAVTGWVDGRAVLRSGATPGDVLWVTGPLGAAAAGLRLLRQAGPGGRARLTEAEDRLAEAHARPTPALAAGAVARQAGATAMIDVSDGFAVDVARMASSSGVGLDLEAVPIAQGATVDEALAGGEDFVLIFTCPAEIDAEGAFERAGLSPPARAGLCTHYPERYHLAGSTLETRGWEHTI